MPASVESGLLQALLLPSTAFQMVSIDLTGPVPWSHDRYRYPVVMVDLYSKYAIKGALRSKKADEVAKWFIRSGILTYFMPGSVVSDLVTELQKQLH